MKCRAAKPQWADHGSAGARAGYVSAQYARSLAEFGIPLELPRSGGWLLRRPIATPGFVDAMGCYPLFACADWSTLAEDLAELPEEIVSVSVVVDPAAEVDPVLLAECFPACCYRYKEHYFADLSVPLGKFVSQHHQRNARRAARSVRVEPIADPAGQLNGWLELYDQLVDRHAIDGIARFSRGSFEAQFTVPGLHVLSAVGPDGIVGMILWMVDSDVAHYHLAAYSEQGYQLKASALLFWKSLEYLAARGVRYAALGSGAGVHEAGEGLSRFKRGWSTETRPAWFCGRIHHADHYARLAAGRASAGHYFPLYRTPQS